VQNTGSQKKELSPASRDGKPEVATKELGFFAEESYSPGDPGTLGCSNVSPAPAGTVPASCSPSPGTAPASLRGTATQLFASNIMPH